MFPLKAHKGLTHWQQRHWWVDDLPTSIEHCLFDDYNMMYMSHNILMLGCGHCQVNMVVADDLAPIWHQAISNHHDDICLVGGGWGLF